MAQTLLVKVQTKDQFGAVLQCSDDALKLPTLRDYTAAGWEMVQLSAEQHAALIILRRATP